MTIEKELKKLRKKWYNDGKRHGKVRMTFVDLGEEPYFVSDVVQNTLDEIKKAPFYASTISKSIREDIEKVCAESSKKFPCSSRYDRDNLYVEIEDAWEVGFEKGLASEILMKETLERQMKEYEEMGKNKEYGNYEDNDILVRDTELDAKEIAKYDDACMNDTDEEDCREIIADISNDLWHAYVENYDEDDDDYYYDDEKWA